MSPLTLMTYNIRLGIQQGLEPIAHIISAQSADIVALQEVGDYWKMGPEGPSTATLAELCDMPHHHHVPAIVEKSHHYGHALLSRHPIEVQWERELPRDKDEPRVLLYAIVRTPGRDVHVLSTHLSWIEDRDAQGEILADEFAALHEAGHHVVVMGDLNEYDANTPWLARLQATSKDADGELARLTFPSTKPRIRIDYLMTNRGQWKEARVLNEQRASDHFPLVAQWSVDA